MAQESAGGGGEVDRKRLEADVRKLLFADCRDTTTWDHLGNLDPVRRPQYKSVRISDAAPAVFDDRLELVPLPVGLAVLYDAAQERGCSIENPLLYALDILSGPAPAPDAFDRLYELAMDRKRRMDAEDAERKRLEQEEEDRACTFHPEVSEHAKKLPSKLKVEGGFYAEGLKWRHDAEKKLRKKVEKEEKDKWEETMAPWHMDERSVKLAVKARQRAADAQVANARPRCITPRNGRRPVPAAAAPTFSPTINRTSPEEILRQLGLEDAESAEAERSPRELGREATAACIQRLQRDVEERRRRQETRAKQRMAQQREKLYDKITGQLLFQPNAMPMVKNAAGDVVPFTELSKQERAAHLKKFRLHEIDFVPAIAAAKAKEPRREMDAVVETMLKHHGDSNRKLAKKRRKVAEEEAEECRFKPKVDRRSAEIASASGSRAPFSERLSHVSAARSRESTTPDKPPEPKLTSAQLQLLLFRQEQFREGVEKNAATSRANAERELESQCTFKPKVNRVSSKLVGDAERRMTVEPHDGPALRVSAADRGASLALEIPPPTERSRSHLDPNRLDPQRHGSFGPLYRTMYGSFDSSCVETSGSFSRRRPGGAAASHTSSPRPTQLVDDETPPAKVPRAAAEVSPADAMAELQTLLNSWSAFSTELERKASL